MQNIPVIRFSFERKWEKGPQLNGQSRVMFIEFLFRTQTKMLTKIYVQSKSGKKENAEKKSHLTQTILNGNKWRTEMNQLKFIQHFF